jgi:hypothetical protein
MASPGKRHAQMSDFSSRERSEIRWNRGDSAQQRLEAFEQEPAGRRQLDAAPRADSAGRR